MMLFGVLFMCVMEALPSCCACGSEAASVSDTVYRTGWQPLLMLCSAAASLLKQAGDVNAELTTRRAAYQGDTV
jgi:hypothetical protein